MGKKAQTVSKVVLDTNVLVSALLFRGELSGLVELWKRREFVPVVSRETFDEFRTVLEYPKFALTKEEIRTIIEDEVLPYFEVVEIVQNVNGVCGDPDDDKFISCALAASAKFIVSGDRDLLEVREFRSIRIIKGADFLKRLL